MNQHDLSRRGVLTLAGGATVAITQGHSAAYAATRPMAKLFMTEVGMGRSVMLLHGWVRFPRLELAAAVVRAQVPCRRR